MRYRLRYYPNRLLNLQWLDIQCNKVGRHNWGIWSFLINHAYLLTLGSQPLQGASKGLERINWIDHGVGYLIGRTAARQGNGFGTLSAINGKSSHEVITAEPTIIVI